GPGSADPKPMVMWKDLLTGSWKGPDVLITAGRGYACVFPQDAESPIWVPDRFIRPFTE
uniref:Pr160 n=1 Tax=Mouse mammary tumor virus TaxID=11757 RepID=UPI00076F13BE|nr:Chain A, Pr160 [Mouse mammary tumor virus]5D7U_B Chain B, Pr160 [Mouse mammary tumor virus]